MSHTHYLRKRCEACGRACRLQAKCYHCRPKARASRASRECDRADCHNRVKGRFPTCYLCRAESDKARRALVKQVTRETVPALKVTAAEVEQEYFARNEAWKARLSNGDI